VGDRTDRQEAITRLLAKGAPESRYRRSLAIRALADRDYARAADFLFTPPWKPTRDATRFYLRLYALCMAGKVEQAQSVAATAARWLPADEVQADYYAWLGESFGFDAAAGTPITPPAPSG